VVPVFPFNERAFKESSERYLNHAATAATAAAKWNAV
jgi:hypothetical protein